MFLTFSSCTQDLEILGQSEREPYEKKPRASKAEIKNEEFEKCKQEGKYLHVKYKECGKHNKNLREKSVSVKTFSIVSTPPYLDCVDVYSATTNTPENNNDELDVIKVYKMGRVILVDSEAAFTSNNDCVELKNLRKVRGTGIEYADGSMGTEITTEENFMLND